MSSVLLLRRRGGGESVSGVVSMGGEGENNGSREAD